MIDATRRELCRACHHWREGACTTPRAWRNHHIAPNMGYCHAFEREPGADDDEPVKYIAAGTPLSMRMDA